MTPTAEKIVNDCAEIIRRMGGKAEITPDPEPGTSARIRFSEVELSRGALREIFNRVAARHGGTPACPA